MRLSTRSRSTVPPRVCRRSPPRVARPSLGSPAPRLRFDGSPMRGIDRRSVVDRDGPSRRRPERCSSARSGPRKLSRLALERAGRPAVPSVAARFRELRVERWTLPRSRVALVGVAARGVVPRETRRVPREVLRVPEVARRLERWRLLRDGVAWLRRDPLDGRAALRRELPPLRARGVDLRELERRLGRARLRREGAARRALLRPELLPAERARLPPPRRDWASRSGTKINRVAMIPREIPVSFRRREVNIGGRLLSSPGHSSPRTPMVAGPIGSSMNYPTQRNDDGAIHEGSAGEMSPKWGGWPQRALSSMRATMGFSWPLSGRAATGTCCTGSRITTSAPVSGPSEVTVTSPPWASTASFTSGRLSP